MNYQEFKELVAKSQIAPVYLFHGDDDFLKAEAVEYLKNNLLQKHSGNLTIEILEEAYTLEEVLEIANTLPLFSHNKLIVVQNCQLFQAKKAQGKQKEPPASEEEELNSYLDNPSPLSHVVFVAKGKADSRKKVVQLLIKRGCAVEFGQLKGKELLDWVKGRFAQRHKQIDFAALDYLVASIGNDLTALEQEIEKICLYLGEEPGQVSMEVVHELVSKTAQTTIFNLVDAFAERRGSAAVQYCRDLLKTGEPEVLIVYMLARQFRLILEAKLLLEQGYMQGELPQVLQVPAFAANKAVKQGQRFSVAQVVDVLEKLLELDVAIKTGQGRPALLLELLIADFCK
ncbi:DNA polymerase III subunit delta [Zhaonella formicivorans]|uniref:DNA polymerase III subunit delta n=1 Tax=Zhaonella formicivorans TaxID=2528593 RepID=UPI0010DC9585|nr:DNA polymerase III subunit delta [Zhaonella formicivorans]